MTENSVTKNTTYLTLSYIGQKILSFIYFVVVARMISVEDFGKYTFALSFTTLFAVFIDLGLTQALIREVAKFKEKGTVYLAGTLFLKFLLSIVVYGAVVVVINWLGYPEETKNLVYISGIMMVLDQLTLSFWGIFRGFQNLKLESISVVINQCVIVLTGFFVLLMMKKFNLPLPYLMIPFLAGSTFSLFFSSWCVRKKISGAFQWLVDWKTIKTLFLIALPFALIAIFSRIYGNLDSVILSKLVGDRAVGLYSAAMKLPFALQFIPAALAAAIFPAFTASFVSDKEKLKNTFERVMKVLIVVVLPISAGTIMLAQPIVSLFYSVKYLEAVTSLEVLMAGLIFVFLNFPLGSLLNGCEKQVTNTVLVACTMVLNIILNFILIPRYSFLGASIAFLLSHTSLFVASMFVAKKIIPYNFSELLKYFLKTVLSAAAMVIPLYFLRDFIPVVPLIVIGALIYFGMIFLIRVITPEDRKFLIQMINRRKNA